MRQLRLGGLEVYIAGGMDGEGSGEGPFVVLLHGFGAPGNDLVSLSQAIDAPKTTRFAFPVGPLSLNLGWPGSRAWWMINVDPVALAQGRGRDVREVPSGLSHARGCIVSFLEDLQNHWHVSAQDIILGGFSQGSMLACDLILRSDQSFASLVMMSGTLIAKEEWTTLIRKKKGLKVFQSHGREDPLLPYRTAQELRDHFIAGGLEVQWQEFTGGHEIPPTVMNSLGPFIRECFKERFLSSGA